MKELLQDLQNQLLDQKSFLKYSHPEEENVIIGRIRQLEDTIELIESNYSAE